jgi:hypothetical protein
VKEKKRLKNPAKGKKLRLKDVAKNNLQVQL